jgi:hypothetical protein
MSKDYFMEDENYFLENTPFIINTIKKNLFKKNIKFIKKFNKQGKQGVVGLLEDKDTNMKMVFKISQYLNFLVTHEYNIMNSLKSLSVYCPHFCKPIYEISNKIDPNFRKSKNPFEIKSKHPIISNTLLMEYVSGEKLSKVLKDKDVPDNTIFNCIKQVLLALALSQEKIRFTHYDLHSDNILLKKCNEDTVFLYIMNETNQYCVPTHGFIPVIIDYGFSYCQNMEGKPLDSSLAHTNVGFMTNQFDFISDSKLFLVSMSEELKTFRSSNKINKLRNIVRNVFSSLDIDWECGWDNYSRGGASDFISEAIEDTVENHKCKVFKEYDHFCIDIVQHLITLPLKERSYKNINSYLKCILDEIYKIEKQISNCFTIIYILKEIVYSAGSLRKYYVKNSTKDDAVKEFTQDVNETLRNAASFVNPKGLNYEKLLCALYCFSNCCEGILYKQILKKNKEKNVQYSHMEISTPEEIYAALEVNLSDDYIFNANTQIYVLDSVNNKRYVKHLTPKLIKLVNDSHPLQRGTLLFDIFNNPKAFDSKYSSPIHVNKNMNCEHDSDDHDEDSDDHDEDSDEDHSGEDHSEDHSDEDSEDE